MLAYRLAREKESLNVDEKLLTVDPPSEDRNSQQVAEELIQLIRHEYKYNTAMLCKLLHCERQWIDRNIRPNVRHIFVTYFFRQYIVSNFPELFLADETEKLMHGYYFYSEQDLLAYYSANAFAERKTVIADLAQYRRPTVSIQTLRDEYELHSRMNPCRKEKERHLEKLASLISEEGLRVYEESSGKKEWRSYHLPSLHSRFITAAEYRELHKLNSNTVAMTYLFQRGAVRVKLGGRALWVVEEPSCVYPIAVQAP